MSSHCQFAKHWTNKTYCWNPQQSSSWGQKKTLYSGRSRHYTVQQQQQQQQEKTLHDNWCCFPPSSSRSSSLDNHHQLGKLTIVNVQLNDALSASETSSEEYWMSWCVKYFWSTWLQKSLIHNSTVESTVLSNWGWKFQLISSGEFHPAPAPAQNQRMKVLTSPDAFALFCWTIDFWPTTFYLQGRTLNKIPI